MPDQPTEDAREWQRERDQADQAKAHGMTDEELADYQTDLCVSRFLEKE